MHRRNFLETAAAGALAAAGAPAQTARKTTSSRQANLKLGTQHNSSEPVLKILAAFGVNHICSTLPSAKMDERWSVESLTRSRETVEKYGIKLEMVPLPLSSA